jgi:hypothetical protein
MKGVSTEAILYKCKKNWNSDVLKMYQEMSKSYVEFDLVIPGGKPRFEFALNGNITTRKMFKRCVGFNIKSS